MVLIQIKDQEPINIDDGASFDNSGNWMYIYDKDGKKIAVISTRGIIITIHK